jgi:hypothetical protein
MSDTKSFKVSDDAEIRMLAVELLEPDPANPNEMNDEDFELLGDTMEEDGVVGVIQAVPIDGKDEYRIVGGEHRWRQAKRRGWKTLPVMVLSGNKWQDDDYRRAMMVRLNTLHGELNPRKFFELWTDLSGRWKEGHLQRSMGFARSGKLQELIGEYRKRLRASGVSGEQVAEFENKAKKAKTVDDLRGILDTIMEDNERHGRRRWMVLSMEGQEHLYVECDSRLWKVLTELGEAVQAHGIDMPEVFFQALHDWRDLPCFGGVGAGVDADVDG